MSRLIVLALSFTVLSVTATTAMTGVVNERSDQLTQKSTVVEGALKDRPRSLERLEVFEDNEYGIEQELKEKVSQLEKQANESGLLVSESQLVTKVEELKVLVTAQQVSIEVLASEHAEVKAELETIKSGGHSGWISILLACVAILVTVLGVVIALISFIGYRNFKEATTEAAENVATSVATTVSGEVANKHIPEIAKKELTRLIDDGELKEHLESAVDMIVRRGHIASEVSGFSKYPEIDEEGGQ